MKAPPKLRVALMSYAMDNRPAKGTALYTRKLVERLIDDPRLDVTLVHYDRTDDPIYTKAREIVMPELRLPVATRFVRQMLFFMRYRGERFDVIHWFQPRLYPFFWLAPAKKIVVTFHGGGDVTAGDKFVLTRLIYNLIAKVFHGFIHAAIAASNAAKEEVAQAYGMSRRKIHAIYNGGGEDFHPIAQQQAHARIQKYDLPDTYLLCISRLQYHKNVEALIKAYALARSQGTVSASLVIIGVPAGDEKVIYRAAASSGYAADIVFRDFVDAADLNALYAAAHAFVFPSLNEGFGLPLIEAMASGTPIASSNATALPEVAGNAALLFDPYDHEDMAAKLASISSDDVLRATLREAGLRRAQEFSWDQTAKKTVDLYDLVTV